MKKKLVLVLALTLLMTLALSVSAFAAGDFVIHAKAPADWGTPALWAWGDAGNVFSAWPGQAMTEDPNNPGWYFFAVPDTTGFAIINNNGAGLQTADLEIEAKEVWLTVADDTSVEIAYSAPAGFTAPATSTPKTGVVGLGLVYGLGILATGAIALTMKKK